MNHHFFLFKKIWPAACCLFALAIIVGCARPIPPTGGKKDTTPPQVDSLGSTKNYRTRFTERSIHLKFDEWVVPPDQGQIVVSPPLAKRPKVTLKGKTVTLELEKEEVLRPNTTYTINFGTAIKDLHENNPAQDLRFVFSTGDFIDSLTVQGTVADALTGEFVENVAVMLYDTLYDSVVVKERPYYFARTDKNGQYIIRNVRPGRFKAVAIEDADGGLKWNGADERIGFADSLLRLDSARHFLALKIFVEKGPQRLLSPSTGRYGQVKLTYALPPENLLVRTDSTNQPVIVERDVDSLLIWYNLPAPRDWRVYIGDDTVRVKAPAAEALTQGRRVVFQSEASAAPGATTRRSGSPTAPLSGSPAPKTLSFIAEKPARLPFATPITAFDTSHWLLMLDSVRIFDFQVKTDSAAPRVLALQAAWKPEKIYRLTLLPGAVTDFFGATNTDTLHANLTILSEKQLGGLNLMINSLKPGVSYVLQIMNGKVMEQEQRFIAKSTEEKVAFKNLPAVVYSVRLIEDRDANGRWSTGSYFKHLQPEPVINRTLEGLRANWEVEATIDAEERLDTGRGKKKGN